MKKTAVGLTLVYTGNGKGKTSAALGTIFRASGHGLRVLMVQFIKGDWPVTFGEIEAARKIERFEIRQAGKGFVKIMGDRKPLAEHRQAALEAFEKARIDVREGKFDVVVLDEICVAMDGPEPLLEIAPVLELIRERPAGVHLILTGRNAKKEILEAADLVTEMKEIKHPFQKGIPAQKGIDF